MNYVNNFLFVPANQVDEFRGKIAASLRSAIGD
jgi:hypothetical protein